ncbi:excalibur calcium-binding domain-containing protein [Arthrobacter sp.]|uniref:excalibur calcium-binding domain-containing protein n=1 Tax=Arthrobacter sp. TaxID=1667 RepID=UPI0033930D38
MGAEHAGKAISVHVIGSWPGPPSVSAYADTEPTAKVAQGTINGSTPTVSGRAAVGDTLGVEAGTWTEGATLSYEWLADGASVIGAAGTTLFLGPQLAGKAIAARVTGAKAGYVPESRTSDPTATIAHEATPGAVTFTDKNGTKDDSYTIPATAGVDYLIGGKAVPAGTYWGGGTVVVYPRAREGYLLAASTPMFWGTKFMSTPYFASADDVTFTDMDGTGAISNTYTIPEGRGVDYILDGKVMSAGTYPGTGSLTIFASPLPDHVLLPLGNTRWTHTFPADLSQADPVHVAHLPVVPAAVLFVDAVVTSGDTYSIPASAGIDYLISGKVVHAGTYKGTGTVTVTAKAQTAYVLAPSATASWTRTFTDSLVGPAPRVTGTAKVGYTLRANPGTWTPAPVSLRYQWYRAGVAIFGATAATYKPTNADAGSTLTVRVIASKTGYTTVGKPSAPTASVVKDSLTGPVPRITGTAKVGYTLSANPGTWTPAPVSLRYQWYRAGVAIFGATAATYKPTNADAGSTLTVRVIASKTGYTTVGKPSAPTAVVAKGSLMGSAPWITGVFEVGYTLTANAGTWSPAPVALRYQWYRSKVAIAGATGATHTLANADAGATITVKLIVSRTGYVTVGATSPATLRIASAYVPPAPRPYEPPAPVAYFANCDAVRAADAAPLYANQPGYRTGLDRDQDGIACE